MASTDHHALLQNLSDGAERMAKICNDAVKEHDEFMSILETRIDGPTHSRRNSSRGSIGELSTVVQNKLQSLSSLSSSTSSSSSPSPSSPSSLSSALGLDPDNVREFFARLVKIEESHCGKERHKGVRQSMSLKNTLEKKEIKEFVADI